MGTKIFAKSVLIVDDARHVVRILHKVFEEAGFDVSDAHDGAEALQLMQEEHFDVLITDLSMPNMDGQQLCQHLASSGPYFPECVFMVTSVTGNIERSWADEHPGISTVEKPVGPRHLLRLVIRRLEAIAEKDSPLESQEKRRAA